MVSIGQCKGSFTLEEANHLLPIISKISREHSLVIDELFQKIDLVSSGNDEAVSEIEALIDESIRVWKSKLTKLNAIPRGLWVVDFPWVSEVNPQDRGYFCWKYPEVAILYWHGLHEGHMGRIKVDEWRRRFDPLDRLDPQGETDYKLTESDVNKLKDHDPG